MYKCIPTEFGVDVGVNKSTFFHYNAKTHVVTDLGGNRVRISRKIDGLHEIYDTPVTDFTDLSGTPLATTPAELAAYFSTNTGAVKAGEGVAVNDTTVSVVAGGPSTLGGFKVGTGLIVDGSGRLSASASSEVTKVIANEAEMLALATEPLRPYRVIRLDTKRLYYLNAGDSPAALGSWFEGPSLETTVLSFNGRTGNIGPQSNDYVADQIEETLTKQFVSPEQKEEWSSKETTTGSQAKATLAQQTAISAAKAYADATFIPLSQKGMPNGVALLDGAGKIPAIQLLGNQVGGVPILDSNNKMSSVYMYRNVSNGVAGLDPNARVPMAQILTNTAGGVPLLDSTGKVDLAQLPSFLPQRKRIWRNVYSIRNRATWYQNTSTNEMEVKITTTSAATSGFLRALVRENSSSTTFRFDSDVHADNLGSRLELNFSLPAGWEYQLDGTSASGRAIDIWYELS